MKKAVLFLIFGLLLFVQVQTPLATPPEHSVELSYDTWERPDDGNSSPVFGPVREPQRDPAGPHDIIYDDGNGATLNTAPNYWSRVTFTPEREFELRAVSIQVYNPNNINSRVNIYVYRENQDNHNLTDMVAEFTDDDVGSRMWTQYLILDENDYVTFDAGENFSVLFGPAPGGRPEDGAEGWWNFFDDGTDVLRSYIAVGEAPPALHRSWSSINSGDLLIRANGEYMANGADLAVENFGNENEGWTIMGGVEANFKVDLLNLGQQDEGEHFVQFWVTDEDNHRVWENVVDREGLEAGGSVEVTTSEPWIAESAGRYVAHVEVISWGEDLYLPNNTEMLEQLVMTTDDPDNWVGYVPENIVGTRWNHEEDHPMAVVFYHPGGDVPLAVKGVRYNIDPNNDVEVGTELRFGIFRIPPGGQGELVWEGTGATESTQSHWVELQLQPEEYVSFWEGYILFVSYFFTDGVMINSDETPPIAANKYPVLPETSVYELNGWFVLNQSDIAMQIQTTESDEIPEGVFMTIEPETVDFGYDLELDRDYVIEAMFISTGTEDVEISRINVSGSAQAYLNIEPAADIVISSQDTSIITLTFNTSQKKEFSANVLIQNNTAVHNIIWHVQASTNPNSVEEELIGGIPTGFSLGQNHPNPFNPSTTIDYALPVGSEMTFEVFDMNGRLINNLHQDYLPAGSHQLEVDLNDFPGGVYLYRLTAGDYVGTRKMVLLR